MPVASIEQALAQRLGRRVLASIDELISGVVAPKTA
jgi:hypothetical protein